MAFVTQSTVSFGDTWSATQHNVMINNDVFMNTAFHVPLPIKEMQSTTGLSFYTPDKLIPTGGGTVKPMFYEVIWSPSLKMGGAWSFMVPRGFASTTLTVTGKFFAATATGNVVFGAQVLSLSATDTHAAAGLATENTAVVAVPGSANVIKDFSITMTNNDSMAAGDVCSLVLFRDGTSGSDTATGGAVYVLSAGLFFNLS